MIQILVRGVPAFAFFLFAVVLTGGTASTLKTRSGLSLASLPLAFEANQGQFDQKIRYLSRGRGLAFFLTDNQVIFELNPDPARPDGVRPVIRRNLRVSNASIRLVGASTVLPHGDDRLPGVANYLIGNDPSRWHTGVPEYGRVRYSQVYPGIDVIYYGNNRELECDFVAAPHADISKIRFRFDGIDGVKKNDAGDLVVDLDGRAILLRKPIAYQEVAGERSQVAADYHIARGSRQIRFTVGKYDPSRPLIIDPLLQYGTFFGGIGNDTAYSIASDSAGNVYVTGSTTSPTLPAVSVAAPFQKNLSGAYDAYVAKLNASGTALVYTTYFGGTGLDEAYSIAVDASGDAYICGATDSPDLPVIAPTAAAAFQSSYGGGVEDGFLAVLNSAGTGLIYSTYLGGSGDDVASTLAVDPTGDVYVTGFTNSSDFIFAAESEFSGGYDTFLVALNSASGIMSSIYFGGSGDDLATAIALTVCTGSCIGQVGVVLAGSSTSAALPGISSSSFQSSRRGVSRDAFLALVNYDYGSPTFSYTTFMGGSSDQVAEAIAVDSNDRAYVTGVTNSPDFPVSATARQGTGGGGNDAFLFAIGLAPGDDFSYSTYLGGSGNDIGYGIAVNNQGDIYVAGYTDSSNFPGTFISEPPQGQKSTFIVEFGPISFDNGIPSLAIAFATYLDATDSNNAVSIATSGDFVYVAGTADSTFQFPASTPVLLSYGGGASDAFVALLANADLSVSFSTELPSQIVPGGAITVPITVLNEGPSNAENVTIVINVSGLTLFQCTASTVCVISGNTATITTQNLGAGSFVTVTLLAGTTTSQQGTSAQVSILASSSTNDPNIGNNQATAAFEIVGVPPFTVSSDLLDFGNVTVGQSSSLSFTITTPGSTIDLNFVLTPGSGTPNNVFSFAPATNINPTVSIPTPVTVVFTPDAAAARTGFVDIIDQQDAFSAVVSFKGSGVNPMAVVTLGAVASAASYNADAVSPGEIVALFGTNIGPATVAYEPVTNGFLGSQLAGVRVLFDGVAAPLLYVSSGQTAAIVPYEVKGSSTSVVVDNQGVQSAPIQVPVASAVPGIFTMNATGTGQGSILNQNLTVNSSSNPEKAGNIIVIYATGEGQTTPAGRDGLINTQTFPAPNQKVTVTIGGRPATVSYAGEAPFLVSGVLQVNAPIPAGTPKGNAEVKVMVGSSVSQSGVTVAVK